MRLSPLPRAGLGVLRREPRLSGRRENLNNHFSRKLKADIFIDDRNLGGLPDWGMIYEMVNKRLSYEDLMRKYESEYEPEKPKGLFSRLFR